MSLDAWQVEWGNGGWVRVTSDTFGGWLYLRIRLDQGRPVPAELYYDGRAGEVAAKLLRELPLANIVAFACDGDMDKLDRSLRRPGADLSLLASHFKTDFGRGTRHWVADSMRAQIGGSDVPQAKEGSAPPPLVELEPPAPLRAPEYGLTDAFLRSVAENYAWAVRRRRRPAPTLAEMAGVSDRTVHGWVSKARQRGIMPPAKPGGVS
jgi:hypothetical protein